jgi:hypothetical protein
MDLGIRSLMSLIFDVAFLGNNQLKRKVIYCHFRAKMALLDNLAARQVAL